MKTLTKRQEKILKELPEKIKRYLKLKKEIKHILQDMEELKSELLNDIDRLRKKSLYLDIGEKIKIEKIEYQSIYINKEKLKIKYPEIFEECKEEKDIMRLDIRVIKKYNENSVKNECTLNKNIKNKRVNATRFKLISEVK